MDTLRSEAKPQLKDFPKVKSDDRHNIQTHVAYLDLLVSKTNTPTAFTTRQQSLRSIFIGQNINQDVGFSPQPRDIQFTVTVTDDQNSWCFIL